LLLGDVELTTSKDVVVAWWGSSTPPKGHILVEELEINTIVYHPQEETPWFRCKPLDGWTFTWSAGQSRWL